MEPGKGIMKRVCVITLFAAIVAVAAVSGCTGLFAGPTPTPVPTVYGPLPSPLPTPTPTPAPGPAIGHSKASNDVYIITSPLDYKVVTDGKTRDGKQYEDISLIVANDGAQPARNIKLVVTIISEYTMNTLVYQEFAVGDLKNGEWKQMTLTTDTHDPCNYILMTIDVGWGESGEYYNPKQYEKTFSFTL